MPKLQIEIGQFRQFNNSNIRHLDTWSVRHSKPDLSNIIEPTAVIYTI